MLACARHRVRCIRWCSAASLRTNSLSRIDDCDAEGDDRGRLLRHRARAASCAYKPLLDARDRDGVSQARELRDRLSARRSSQPNLVSRAAISSGAQAQAGVVKEGRSAACEPVGGTRIRSTFSIPRARQACRRAWCATTAGHMVALKWTMPAHLRHQAGRDLSGRRRMWAGSSAIPTSSTRRCCTAATTIVFEGKPVGTPDAGVFWRVIEEHKVVCTLHGADGVPGHQEGRSGRRADRRIMTCRISARCSWRASAPTRTPQVGGGKAESAGDRPLVADGDGMVDLRPIQWGSVSCRSSTARRRCRCRATTCRSSTMNAKPGRIGRDGHDLAVKLPLPPVVPADALERARPIPLKLSRGPSRLLHDRRMPATRTRTATST